MNCRAASDSNRDLPMPASPSTSIAVRSPWRAASTAAPAAASHGRGRPSRPIERPPSVEYPAGAAALSPELPWAIDRRQASMRGARGMCDAPGRSAYHAAEPGRASCCEDISNFADLQAVLTLATDPDSRRGRGRGRRVLVVSVDVDVTAPDIADATELGTRRVQRSPIRPAGRPPSRTEVLIRAHLLIAKAPAGDQASQSLKRSGSYKKPPNGGGQPGYSAGLPPGEELGLGPLLAERSFVDAAFEQEAVGLAHGGSRARSRGSP